MKLHTKPLLLLTLTACLLLFAGCHGSKEQTSFSVPEAFDTSKYYEITFWAKNDTNKTQTDIYKKAISDFQELYPNITVNIRLYTDYGKITAWAAANWPLILHPVMRSSQNSWMNALLTAIIIHCLLCAPQKPAM